MFAKHPWMEKTFQKLLSWLERLAPTPLLELLGLVAGGWIYLYGPLHFSYPLGYGGFYALMAENVAANPLHPALHLPFYGGGDTIFAYPPFGVYLMGLWLRLSGYNPDLALAPKSPLLLYFRFAPAIYSILFLVAVYFLARVLFSSRVKGVIAMVLVSTVGIIFSYHGTVAGVIRAPAYAFCIAGLAFYVQSVKQKDNVPSRRWKILVLLAGICFGATILTHLSYVAFFVLSILLLALFLDLRKSVVPLLGAICIGLLLALPWILRTGITFGWQVYSNAFQTHGSLKWLPQILADPFGWPKGVFIYLLQLRGDWTPAPLFGAGLIGLGYSLVRRNWLASIWFGATLLAIGESERYLTMILCLGIADLLVDLPNLVAKLQPSQSPLSRLFSNFSFIVAISLVLSYFWALGRENVKYSSPILSDDFLQATQWVRENTPSNDIYLFVSSSFETPEWLPYLTRRHALFSPWGGEWNGTYHEQLAGEDELLECALEESYTCISDFLASNNLKPDLLIVPTESNDILAEIKTQSDWSQVFANDAMVVFDKP
jgi:hypothetical protein